jgi:hypothetical protein
MNESERGNRLHNMSGDELVAILSKKGPTSQEFYAANAELTRRTAQAQEEAARYTRQNARWMFWSVIAIVITSFANLAMQIWNTVHHR